MTIYFTFAVQNLTEFYNFDVFNLNYPSQSKCQNNGISIWSVTISAVFTRQRKTLSIMGNNIESYLCQTKATLLTSQILYDIYLHF